MNLRNSTLSGNSAANAGGGIYLMPAEPLTIDNSTFFGNTSTAGGGIWGTGFPGAVTNSTFYSSAIDDPFVEYAALSLSNTIVADSACAGVADGGYNIDTGTSCGFTAATSQSNFAGLLLDPLGLQDNGGPTQTIALQAGSTAIDSIPVGANGCGAVVRPTSAVCRGRKGRSVTWVPSSARPSPLSSRASSRRSTICRRSTW